MGMKSRIMGVKKCFELIRIRWLVWKDWRRNRSSHKYFEEFLVFLGFVHSPTFEITLAMYMCCRGLDSVLDEVTQATSEFAFQAKTILDMLENNKKEDKSDDHE